MKVTNQQIKNHMWLFVNTLIENPAFDSQTKETLTTQAKSFGSKCELSEKFMKDAQKCGIVDAILSWVNFKQEKQKDKAGGKKTTKIKVALLYIIDVVISFPRQIKNHVSLY